MYSEAPTFNIARLMSSASRRIFAAAIVLTPAITAAQQAPPPADSQTARPILDGYVSEARSATPALAQQTAALRRANAGLREANGRFLPSVGLNARYSEFSGCLLYTSRCV